MPTVTLVTPSRRITLTLFFAALTTASLALTYDEVHRLVETLASQRYTREHTVKSATSIGLIKLLYLSQTLGSKVKSCTVMPMVYGMITAPQLSAAYLLLLRWRHLNPEPRKEVSMM
jgi:hypothetical protein